MISKNFDNYKKYRNIVISEVKEAKKCYIVNQISEDRGNSKKIWQHLKQIGYKNKSNKSANIVLDIEGQRCFDTKTIADYINTFFTGVAKKIGC